MALSLPVDPKSRWASAQVYISSSPILFVIVLVWVIAGSGCSDSEDSTPAPLPHGGEASWAVVSDPSVGMDIPYGVAIDGTDMYVVGSDYFPGNARWRIEKRSLADGALVSSFGTGGAVVSYPNSRPAEAFAVAVDSTALYVVGFDRLPAASDNQWRIEKRLKTDGALVAAFGSGGIVASNPSSGQDDAMSICLDSTSLYVAGTVGLGQWQIEKRSLADGSLVPGFGTGGVATSSGHVPYTMALDSSAMYVAGTDHDSSYWRIEKRTLADGSPVSAFGAAGVVLSFIGTSFQQRARALCVDSSAFYVVGEDTNVHIWRIEKRSATDGSLSAGFGTNGVILCNVGGGIPYAAALDSSSLYVAGNDNNPGDDQWRVEKRNTVDGALDATFGSGGIYCSNPRAGYDCPRAMASDSSALYIVGFDLIPGSYEWRFEKVAK